jgi:uncharacterized protein YkwD
MLRRYVLFACATVGGSYVAARHYEDRVNAALGYPDAGDRDDTADGESAGAGPEGSAVAAAVVEEINSARFEAGVADVGRDGALRQVAEHHSRDMFVRDFYDHTNPDGEGPADRAPCRAAEVLHRGRVGARSAAELAAAIVAAWRNSDGHRQIILSEGVTSIGVGIHIDGGEFHATAMFC